MISESEWLNGQVRGIADQFERIVRLWDAHARGENDVVAALLETEVLLIVMTYEHWAGLDLNAPTRQMVPVVLEQLLAGFERHGNVVAKIEIGGEEVEMNCEAKCRELLRRPAVSPGADSSV